MPVYCYTCPECGETQDEYRLMSKRNADGPNCPCMETQDQEGLIMERDITKELVKSNQLDFYTPIVSDSMSVGPHKQDVDAHRRKHPNMTITDLGQPVWHNQHERRSYLKKEGFEDKRGYG